MNTTGPGQRGAVFSAGGGTARLMFYALVAISLMALDYRGQYVERFQSLAGQLVEPVFWAVDLPFASAERLAGVWRERADTSRRLETLERDLTRARARLGRLADLEAENAELRALLQTAQRTEPKFIAAELASIDLDPFAHRIMVRRGRADGIRVGMPVIDARGVIGQVDRVYARLARVILVSDPDHALPIQILPGRERTIAYGSGSLDRLRLPDLPMNAEVNTGDLAVTSGFGGRFPAGLPVARIDTVLREPGEPFATAYATPLSAMDRNRVVLILERAPPPGDPPPADDESGAAAASEPGATDEVEAPSEPPDNPREGDP